MKNNTVQTNNQQVSAYNDNVAEAHYQALTGASAWPWQTPRYTMADILRKRDLESSKVANDNNVIV